MSYRGYAESARTDALIARNEARRATEARDAAVSELAAHKAALHEQLVAAYREGWADRDQGRAPRSAPAAASIAATGAL